MSKIKYFRTWQLTTYNGNIIFGVEYSDDDGKTWWDECVHFQSYEQAEKYIKSRVEWHAYQGVVDEEIIQGNHPFYTTPILLDRETEWKQWHAEE